MSKELDKAKDQDEFEGYPDEFWDDYEENDEPDYYYCNCCNHTQSDLGWGASCDKCGLFNVMEAGYF